jgi:hypothetical protein
MVKFMQVIPWSPKAMTFIQNSSQSAERDKTWRTTTATRHICEDFVFSKTTARTQKLLKYTQSHTIHYGVLTPACFDFPQIILRKRYSKHIYIL